MYVHVGKDVSINFKDVIAILDIKALKKTKKIWRSITKFEN